jgi:hypothetical protein
MAKIIRPTYPAEFSFGILLLIFLLSSFLSYEIFDLKWHDVIHGGHGILPMALAGLVVVIATLIMWEEFLFPVRIKPMEDEIIFRNHFTKLKMQVLIYSAIPIIVVFLYLNFDVNPVVFTIWASFCVIAPVTGKLISGIKNYNDFLKLSGEAIAFKNNQKEGVLIVKEIEQIRIITNAENGHHKLQIFMKNNNEETIDLDEMELEDYYKTIEQFIHSHYKGLIK